MTNTFTLISCSKSKQDGEHTAKNLYTESTIFNKRKKFAEKQGGKWGILSAKYGYLRPWENIPYYQKHISSRSEIWGAFVLQDLLPDLEFHDIDEVIILAGKRYINPIRAGIEANGYKVNDWNKGKMPGERLHALKEELAPGTQTTF